MKKNLNRLYLHVPYKEKELAKAIPSYYWEGGKVDKHSPDRDLWSWDRSKWRQIIDIFPSNRDEIIKQCRAIKNSLQLLLNLKIVIQNNHFFQFLDSQDLIFLLL